MGKEFKCHFCKQTDTLDNLIIKSVGKLNRKFHEKCYEEFIREKEEKKLEEEKKKLEFQEWCKVYEYVKIEILGYKKEMVLSNHARNRLQALRIGKYGLKRNDKLSDEGYPFDVILTTFKVKKIDILKSLKGKTFNSENHKFDYIMVIITNSINDVYIRYLNTKKTNETFETIDINTEDKKSEYKNNNIQQDKVANLLNDLF